MPIAEGILEENFDGEVLILDPWRIDGGPWNEGWFYVVFGRSRVPRGLLRRGAGVRVSGSKGRGRYGGNYPWLKGKLPVEKVSLVVKRNKPKPEQIKDAVLGTLELDAMGFTGWRKHGGATYELSIAEDLADDVKRARTWVQRTWKALPAIRRAATTKLHPLWEKRWRGDGKSLTAAQFQKRISKLESLQVTKTRITLIFSASGLFTDHGVLVELAAKSGKIVELTIA